MPFVQTKIAQYFTNSLNKDFGTNIAIDEVAISVFGGVKFKKVLTFYLTLFIIIISQLIIITLIKKER